MSGFLAEIYELPHALKRMVQYYRSDGRTLILEWVRFMQGRNNVLFTGMGTSEFAPLIVMDSMASLGLSSRNIDAGEWLHYGVKVPGPDGVVVIISQSGESIEIKKLIEGGKAGESCVAVTNEVDSILGRNVALTLPLCAGDEASISTKTYCNTLGLLHLLINSLHGSGGLETALLDLENVAEVLLSVDREAIRASADFLLLPSPALVFVARGPAYVCAKQCALTFMEGAHCVGSAFTGGAFRHGPMEAINDDFRLVLFNPEGTTTNLINKMADDAARLGARVVVITDQQRPQNGSIKTIIVRKPKTESTEQLFPITVAGAQNLLLSYYAEAKGIQAGHFRYGNKVTTQE